LGRTSAPRWPPGYWPAWTSPITTYKAPGLLKFTEAPGSRRKRVVRTGAPDSKLPVSGRKGSSKRSWAAGKASRWIDRSRVMLSAVTGSSDGSARYERLHPNPERNVPLAGRSLAHGSPLAGAALLGRQSRSRLLDHRPRSRPQEEMYESRSALESLSAAICPGVSLTSGGSMTEARANIFDSTSADSTMLNSAT
jgi:hypothetical protein